MPDEKKETEAFAYLKDLLGREPTKEDYAAEAEVVAQSEKALAEMKLQAARNAFIDKLMAEAG